MLGVGLMAPKFTVLMADDVDWEQCHHCSSHDIEGGFVEVEGRHAYQTVQCLTCGHEWTEVYEALQREKIT